MDVISMQIANKILRKINTNYNGFYELQTSITGQTEFSLSKEYGFGQHTLGVYVDGAMAYEKTDYVEVDATSIRFVHPMDGGELILFKTEVAGTTSYPILNPAYDDTSIKELIQNNTDTISNVDGKLSDAKNRITTTEEKIANIIAVLDADNDGSIVDALADLKIQWESADSDLTNLISNKVEQSVFDTLKEEVETARGTYASLNENLTAIIEGIANYDDSVVKQDISNIKSDIQVLQTSIDYIETLNESISNLANRVSELEAKSGIVLKDTVTGWDYNIAITNGNLVTQLIKILSKVLIERNGAGEVKVGDTITFNVTPQYQDNSTASTASLAYYINDNDKASIDLVSGQFTALAIGEVIVTVKASIETTMVENQITITIKLNDVQKLQTSSNNFDVAIASIDLTNIISEFVLPTEQDYATITWKSDDNSTIGIIDGNATVTRPSFTDGNKTVGLTATLNVGSETITREYVATVIALPQTDFEKLTIASNNLTLGDISEVISDITLPMIQDEADITWVSDTPEIIDDTGTVIQPINGEGDATVKMTATLKVNSQTTTKEFIVTVKESVI